MMSQDTNNSVENEDSYAPRERGLARRDKILDAATVVFSQHGFEAASLQEIVARAGGSLTTLYRQFGNKEGLFKAMVERKSNQLLAHLSTPNLDGKDPSEVLFSMGMGFLDMLLTPEVGAVHRLLIAEAGRHPQLREIFLKVAPERNLRALADYLQKLSDSNYLQLDDCYLAATQLLGMIKGHYHMRCVLGENVQLTQQEKQRFIRQAVKLFLYGCKIDSST